MGIDSTQLISHNLHYKHTDQLIQQVEERTGMPVLTTRYHYEDDSKCVEAPKGFKGWTIRTEDDLTLQEFSATGGMLEMYAHGVWENTMEIYVNPYLFEFSGDDFYMGRWSAVKAMADYIRENGIPSAKDYGNNSSGQFWLFEARKKLFEFCSFFKIPNPVMITFCNDLHQEWLEYFFKKKWSVDDFINWGKKELIYVKFSELTTFEFPANEPEYYNVFIEDDFADLK